MVRVVVQEAVRELEWRKLQQPVEVVGAVGLQQARTKAAGESGERDPEDLVSPECPRQAQPDHHHHHERIHRRHHRGQSDQHECHAPRQWCRKSLQR